MWTGEKPRIPGSRASVGGLRNERASPRWTRRFHLCSPGPASASGDWCEWRPLMTDEPPPSPKACGDSELAWCSHCDFEWFWDVISLPYFSVLSVSALSLFCSLGVWNSLPGTSLGHQPTLQFAFLVVRPISSPIRSFSMWFRQFKKYISLRNLSGDQSNGYERGQSCR